MINLPNPPVSVEPGLRSYIIFLLKALVTVLDTKIDRNTAVSSILLASPNGSVYTVAVADDGTITTELVYDNSP